MLSHLWLFGSACWSAPISFCLLLPSSLLFLPVEYATLKRLLLALAKHKKKCIQSHTHCLDFTVDMLMIHPRGNIYTRCRALHADGEYI